MKAPHRCIYCGAETWVDPADQEPPSDYCCESDHGEPDVEGDDVAEGAK